MILQSKNISLNIFTNRILLFSFFLLFFAIVWPVTAAHAQSLNIDLGAKGAAGTTGHLVQLSALITVLSLAPSLLVMVTAFTRIIVVLSLLRGAIGAQGTPPNTVLIGLALFLTLFVMQPVFQQSWTQGVSPLIEGRISEMDGLKAAAAPFHDFMLHNVRPADLETFSHLAHMKSPATAEETPWRVLMPAFMIGELRRGFEMGFLLYLPFLIIDLVVSTILMSLGMMMLPPTTISLPFKLIFFVMIDGWQLTAGSLVRSFGGG
jgi:flagellar biosynthetic protein FliP